MRYTRILRHLSLPVAAGLGAALVVACAEDLPTDPRVVLSDPAFAIQTSYVDDTNGECPKHYTLVNTGVSPAAEAVDDNNNDLACRKTVGGSGGKKDPGGPKK